MPPDPFSTLGLQPDADRKAVRAAYAELVRSVPPDADPARFQRLREARDEALARLKRTDGAPKDSAVPRAADTDPEHDRTPVAWSDLEWLGIESSEPAGEGAEKADVDPASGPKAPERAFSYWDWEAGAPHEPPPERAGDEPGDGSPAPSEPLDDAPEIGLLGEDALPPLTQFTIACAMLAGDAVAPKGWADILAALDRLPLADRLAMREPIAMEILIGDALHELAAREGGRGANGAVPVETARIVAALAGELDWTRTGGLFEHIGGREGEALMRLVEQRAADAPGGRVRGGVERDANGLPTIAAERLRPWLEPGAERYLAALERARERGRWGLRLSWHALFGGLFWAARRRAVGAYGWLFGGAALLIAGLHVVGDHVPDIGSEGQWLAIGSVWLLANLWPALNADRYAVEAAAALARDPAKPPEGARSPVIALVMGALGIQAMAGLGLVTHTFLVAVVPGLVP